MAELDPISLNELDEQSRMRRRRDTKYVVPLEVAEEIVRELDEDYRALEIDGTRRFTYESVYFDTPKLRCYVDHVDGRRPRFKVRSRLYRETEACFFEVKVRGADEQTVKRQLEYGRSEHGSITDSARQFLEQTLDELADEAPPSDLAPSLSTRYERLTLGARDGDERATLDLSVQLRSMEDRQVELSDDLILIETKTDGEDGRLDDKLLAADCEPRSISKYRMGIGLLLADLPDSFDAAVLARAFA